MLRPAAVLCSPKTTRSRAKEDAVAVEPPRIANAMNPVKDRGSTPPSSAEEFMSTSSESIVVEVRAAEGGDDAKLLVLEQVKIYLRLCARRSL